MSANDKQVAGSHYKTMTPDIPQHWDIVALHNLDYFQGQITKYVMRWKNKNGIQDLQKALHFLEKYIELNSPKEDLTGVKKYPDDYQEQLAVKMEKMREDAMIGIPEHLRAEMIRQNTEYFKKQVDSMEIPSGPLINNYVSPMMKNFWNGEEPQSQGYVNQDGNDQYLSSNPTKY